MTWHKTIKQWLEHSDRYDLEVGERSEKWIASFRKDLERWGFPVKIRIDNPIIVKGAVLVSLVKTGVLK